MPKDMNSYVDEAKKRFEGDYATRLQELQRLKDEKLSGYDSTSKSLESQYGSALEENRKSGVHRVNDYNNNTLSRGLGRSTIATTGIAGIENQTANSANQLTQEKLAKLADINTQRNNYMLDYDRGVNAVNQEKLSAINKYAQDLYNKDLEWERQIEEQKRREAVAAQQAAEEFARQQQLAAQRASYSSSSTAQSKNDLYADFMNLVQSQDNWKARDFLDNNKQNIIDQYGSAYYKKMQDAYWNDMGDYYANKVKISKNQMKY